MKQPKVIITGPGRSGTTILVKLFTLLRLPTGFNQRDFASIHKSGGGLEFYCNGPNQGPEIVKAPQYYNMLPKMAEWYDVKAVILPIRDLYDSAASRDALPDGTPGSKWGATDLQGQINHNAKVVYQVVRDCAALDIPLVLLDFPRFATDYVYMRQKMAEIWPLFMSKPTWNEFLHVYNRVMDKGKIKRYKKTP